MLCGRMLIISGLLGLVGGMWMFSLQMYIDYADLLASVGGYISAFKISKFLELMTMFCSEGMQCDLMLQFACWLMPHCIHQRSQHKTTGTQFGLWNLWNFKWLCVCHVMVFLPEVYNSQQVQCPLVTILDVFVASNIDQSLQKYDLLVLFLHACPPKLINTPLLS